MESTQTKVRINWVVYTTVIKVEERFTKFWVSGQGEHVVWRDDSQGWFLTMQGSYESLYLGTEKPDLNPGDRMKITFEKVPNGP